MELLHAREIFALQTGREDDHRPPEHEQVQHFPHHEDGPLAVVELIGLQNELEQQVADPDDHSPTHTHHQTNHELLVLLELVFLTEAL